MVAVLVAEAAEEVTVAEAVGPAEVEEVQQPAPAAAAAEAEAAQVDMAAPVHVAAVAGMVVAAQELVPVMQA